MVAFSTEIPSCSAILAGLVAFGVYRRRKQKNEKNLDAFEMDLAMANVGP